MAGWCFFSRKDEDGSPNLGPVVEPVGVWGGQIDTAVRHRCAEVTMPVGAVEAVALVKVHGPRDIGQVVPRSGHAGFFQFDVNSVVAENGGVGGDTGGDQKLFEEQTVFVGVDFLIGDDGDDLLTHRDGLRRSWRGWGGQKKQLAGLNEVGVGKTIDFGQVVDVQAKSGGNIGKGVARQDGVKPGSVWCVVIGFWCG